MIIMGATPLIPNLKFNLKSNCCNKIEEDEFDGIQKESEDGSVAGNMDGSESPSRVRRDTKVKGSDRKIKG
jgi:hypothetical protein